MIIALFLWGGELIEVGDELAFEYKNNRDGFFKVLLCKNLTKDWVGVYGVVGIGIIILKIIGFTFPCLFILGIIAIALSTKNIMISLLLLFGSFLFSVASIYYFIYSTRKKIAKKFIKRHNL